MGSVRHIIGGFFLKLDSFLITRMIPYSVFDMGERYNHESHKPFFKHNTWLSETATSCRKIAAKLGRKHGE